ncbi:MAG: CrcB family protein [Balneolaceae bacterium]
MRELIFIAFGGALGSVLRYLTSVWTLKLVGESWLVTGTTIVNITGCFFIGLIAYVLEAGEWTDATLKLFLIVGFLGGFTTFSSFGIEGFQIAGESLQQGLLYMALQVVAGFGAVWLGLWVGKWIL